jgi:transcription-repair coupling factor (superfamily II helicase)
MIRGAGDILGPEQAGFIDSIGLDMYIKLLNEAVQDKLKGVVSEEEHSELNLNLSVEAYIPSSYANDSDKIELYQEINSATNVELLMTVKHKVIDIYGKLPKEVDLLFKKRYIDILSKEAFVKSLTERQTNVELVLEEEFNKIRGVGNILFETLIPFISFTKIAYRNHEFRITMNKRKTWLQDLIDLLEGLDGVINLNKKKEQL